jgi:hypothetical protein
MCSSGLRYSYEGEPSIKVTSLDDLVAAPAAKRTRHADSTNRYGIGTWCLQYDGERGTVPNSAPALDFDLVEASRIRRDAGTS